MHVAARTFPDLSAFLALIGFIAQRELGLRPLLLLLPAFQLRARQMLRSFFLG